jgi:hypothetical protein
MHLSEAPSEFTLSERCAPPEEGRPRVLRGNDRLGSQGVLSGFSWVLMSTHGFSWVLMGSHGFSVGSHGFSVGTQTVHFWVLRGSSGRHPPSGGRGSTALVGEHGRVSNRLVWTCSNNEHFNLVSEVGE